MSNQHLKYTTGLRRLGAAIVDTLIFLPVIFADIFIGGKLQSTLGILAWLCFMTALPICYSVFMHYFYGQTIGKMVANVKVVALNESDTLTFKQAVLRDSFYIIFQTVALLNLIFHIPDSVVPLSALIEEFNNFGQIVGLSWLILELVSMLTNKKRRAVHDFIAGSVVIRTDR